jgi:hypothetical protein
MNTLTFTLHSKNFLESKLNRLVLNNTIQTMNLGKHISESEAKMKFDATQACMELEALAQNSSELTGQARHAYLEKLRMVKDVGLINVRNKRRDALEPIKARANANLISQIELNQCESVIHSMAENYQDEIKALFHTVDLAVRGSGPIAKPEPAYVSCPRCGNKRPLELSGRGDIVLEGLGYCSPCWGLHLDEVARKNSLWGKFFG